MLRRLLIAFTALAPALAVTPALAESSTIRIEPRPYYGAVVTLEQGVRVWRPLPPTRHMIINPTNAPVNLSVADVRETHTSHNYVHGAPGVSASAVAGSGHYGVPFVHARPFRHRGHGIRRH